MYSAARARRPAPSPGHSSCPRRRRHILKACALATPCSSPNAGIRGTTSAAVSVVATCALTSHRLCAQGGPCGLQRCTCGREVAVTFELAVYTSPRERAGLTVSNVLSCSVGVAVMCVGFAITTYHVHVRYSLHYYRDESRSQSVAVGCAWLIARGDRR